jgi:diadenylate cyclase
VEDLLRPFLSLRELTTREIVISVIDILLVTFLIYRLLMLVRGTRAWRIILGIVGFLFVLYVSGRTGMNTLHWLLDKATYVGPAVLAILFLPELRTAIEGFGRPATTLIPRIVTNQEERAEARTVEELVAAVAELAAGRVGALIVVEKDSPLTEIASNGVSLHALVSAPLLGSIFYEGNPLHDGAVLVRGDMILAAACRLPLSESPNLDPNVHMRHRAAVGATEAFDCMVIVVSEERGTISIAQEGRLRRLGSPLELRGILNRELRHLEEQVPAAEREPKSRRSRLRRNGSRSSQEVKP